MITECGDEKDTERQPDNNFHCWSTPAKKSTNPDENEVYAPTVIPWSGGILDSDWLQAEPD